MKNGYLKGLGFGVAAAMLAALTACGGGGSGPVADTGSGMSVKPTALSAITGPGDSAPRFPDSLEGLTPTPGKSSPARRMLRSITQDGGYTVDTSNREEVRLFYKAVYGSSENVASGWTGDVSTCNAGDTSPEFKAATLRRINWFRAMAGVPANVQFDPVFNAKAQQAALIMSANNQLNHTPPVNSACYSLPGFEAAGNSNLGLGNLGPTTITKGYMGDPGPNNSIVGHRRWLLFPQTQFMGVGDIDGSTGTASANALWIFDNNYFGPRPAVRDDFVAWPAKGYSPYTTVYPRWSFSYPKADFSSAKINITENGMAITSRLETVSNNAGENTIVWLPANYTDGMTWERPKSDTVYQVTVSDVILNGQKRSFSYVVTVFDPDQEVLGGNNLALTGASTAVVGQANNYSFTPVSGATDYQWRTFTADPFTFNDGAESGVSSFITSTSPDYQIVTADASATGSKSFHLAHTRYLDQTLQLKSVLVGTPSSVIKFNSRLGSAASSQIALLESSTDNGNTWQALYQQSGSNLPGSSELNFTNKQVSLSQFAGKVFQLRFNYALKRNDPSGYYISAFRGVGWYIDDVQIDGVLAQTSVGPPVDSASNDFTLMPGSPGSVFLQVRPGLYGFYGDWGAAKRVSIQTPSDTRDCIMNWAERTYPGTFSTSPSATSKSNAVYYFRYYTINQSAIGFSKEDTVHYLAPGTDTAINIGSKYQWMINSGCS